MEFTDPYEIDVPPGTRGVGEGPFWSPGSTVTWSFRRFDFDRDRAEVRRPMSVIEDGPDGAVLWMAGGTETTDTRIVGWEDHNPHDVPLTVRFRPLAEAPRRIMAPGHWRGLGVLKIVPAHVPFSVWVLLKPGDAGSVRAEWYVNLEATHQCTADALYTSDHILDITFPEAAGLVPGEQFDPSGAVFKDVDELAAAANYEAWPQAWSETIRGNGSELLDHLGEFTWAFDLKWEVKARALASGATAETAAMEAAETSVAEPKAGTVRLGAAPADSNSSRNQEHRLVKGGCLDKDRI